MIDRLNAGLNNRSIYENYRDNTIGLGDCYTETFEGFTEPMKSRYENVVGQIRLSK